MTGDGDREPPTVIHQPVATAPAGKPLAIAAEVRDPSGVKWVRLRYRSVNQQEDYRTLPMLPTGEKDLYQAVIPAEHVVPAWDLMYLIEVMDNRGNGQIHPDLNQGDAVRRCPGCRQTVGTGHAKTLDAKSASSASAFPSRFRAFA